MNLEKKKILVVDDIELNRAILCEIFQDTYPILEAGNGVEALRLLEEQRGQIALVLLDAVMPVMDGFQVLDAMKDNGMLAQIPVIMISAEDTEDFFVRGYERGACDFIGRPFSPKLIYHRCDNVIRLYNKTRGSSPDSGLFCVEQTLKQKETLTETDREDEAKKLPQDPAGGKLSDRTLWLLQMEREKYKLIAEMAGDIVFEYDRKTAAMQLTERCFEVFAVPDGRKWRSNQAAMQLSQQQRNAMEQIARSFTRQNPYCRREALLDTKSGKEWFEFSAHALWESASSDLCVGCVGKLTNIDQQKKENIKLRAQADSDTLTGVLNRRAFGEAANAYFRSAPLEEPFAVLVADINHFKRINDRMGRLFGNALLINLAVQLERICGDKSLIGRIGGDEFIVLLKNTEETRAEEIAQDVCQACRELYQDEYMRDGMECSVGVTVGLCGQADYAHLVEEADGAMRYALRSLEDGYAFVNRMDSDQREQLQSIVEEFITEPTGLGDESDLNTLALGIFERSGDFETSLKVFMGVLGSRLSLTSVSVTFMDLQHKETQCRYGWSCDGRTEPFSALSSQGSDLQRVYESYDDNGIFVLNFDDPLDGYTEETKRTLRESGVKSAVYAAIYMEGNYLGAAVYADHSTKRSWTPEELQLLAEVSKIISAHITKEQAVRRAAERVEYVTNYDALTGLLNFTRFLEVASDMVSAGERKDLAVLYFDIINFKYINEREGYRKGNEILCDLSEYLYHSVGRTLTRIVADQFVAMVAFDGDRERFEQWINAVNDEFNRQYNQQEMRLRVHLRTGVYFWEEDRNSQDSVTIAVDRANNARRTVMQGADSSVAFFNTAIIAQQAEENELLNRVDYALAHDEFQVFLQPKVDLQTGEFIGAEALARWILPDGRLLSPERFIPLLEKNGALTKLDSYMLDRVLQLLHTWKQQGKRRIFISFNITVEDILRGDIVEKAKTRISELGIEPELVEFELTECSFVDNTQIVAQAMRELREYGFKTSIDDFGAGYSVLNVLADMPADVIKMDRDFLLSCEKTRRGRMILAQLVGMIRQLGYTVICEGVETKEQMEFLRDIQCQLGQGYYFARPLPLEEFTALAF